MGDFESILRDPDFLETENSICTCCNHNKNRHCHVHFNKYLSYEIQGTLKPITKSKAKVKPSKSSLASHKNTHRSEGVSIAADPEPTRRKKPVQSPDTWIIDKPTKGPERKQAGSIGGGQKAQSNRAKTSEISRSHKHHPGG